MGAWGTSLGMARASNEEKKRCRTQTQQREKEASGFFCCGPRRKTQKRKTGCGWGGEATGATAKATGEACADDFFSAQRG
ncbi:hypothetical protein [Pandoravirus japonicus]|uniref:Uncharacterized protein n=1 Tax=Pandoravirus japonicus TaxID=2823154 RepID=A0A811BM40_9VIRU|nr:hypothetical protein [Pandoravirus japonicus]